MNREQKLEQALKNLISAADKAGICDDIVAEMYPESVRNGQPKSRLVKDAQRAMNEARAALALETAPKHPECDALLILNEGTITVSYETAEQARAAYDAIEAVVCGSPAPKVTEEAVERVLEAAVRKLLACPAIADGNHSEPAWGCRETAEAEAFARAALEAAKGGEG